MERRVKPVGALVKPDGVLFSVWAPKATDLQLMIANWPEPIAMQEQSDGYFEKFVPELTAGARYHYRLNQSGPLPDPASRFQPDGVHGDSEVVDPGKFDWQDHHWAGVNQTDIVIYELHVGTFSQQGTFKAVQQQLPYLADLGITALELLPISEFAGRWNWGYDVAALYAPSHRYGSPDELRELVNAAHQHGLAVLFDVVYNHFGPDGNYAQSFGHYSSDKHTSPWGHGLNFDDHDCHGVRNFFIDNAVHWLREYHVDGLRLDATHAIADDSTPHFLEELSATVESIGGRKRYLIAEDERNLVQLVCPRSQHGYGLDGVWADDFHHQVRNLTTHETEGYLGDFANTTTGDLATTITQGWYYTGQFSRFAQASRGTLPQGTPLEKFIFCIQNHDQIGNRAAGDRIHHKIADNVYRSISALLLMLPETPLLFMGQEWSASTPFQFFSDHHGELSKLVTEGRKKEFENLPGSKGEVTDPQDPETFRRSTLNWNDLEIAQHQKTHQLYRDLLRLRQTISGPVEVLLAQDQALVIRRAAHLLLVALADNQCLPTFGAEPILFTEHEKYATSPTAPHWTGQQIHFPIASAVWCTTYPPSVARRE